MNFEQKIWYNKDSDGNIPTGAPRFDADNMNRIEQCLFDLVQYTQEFQTKIANMPKPCDYSNILIELEADDKNASVSWTATEDCWLSILAYTSSGSHSAYICIDGNEIYRSIYTSIYKSPNNYSLPSIYIKKGSTVTATRETTSGGAGFKAYACLS